MEGEEVEQLDRRWRQDRDVSAPPGQPPRAPPLAGQAVLDRPLDKAVACVESTAEMKPAKRR